MKRVILLMLLSLFAISTMASPTLPSTQLKKGIITVPGFCEIEVANQSYQGAWVDIRYDNGVWRHNNYVYPDQSLMIPLDYYPYCDHSAAWLNIYSYARRLLFTGYVSVGHTVTIIPTLNKDKVSIKQS